MKKTSGYYIKNTNEYVPEHDVEDDTNASISIFYKWAKRGRIIGQIKEKYNTTRWYAYLNVNQWPIYSIFKPCYMFYHWPKWIMHIDNFLGKYIVNPLFGNLIMKWKIYCYRQAYLECSIKYPFAYHAIDHTELFTKKELDIINKIEYNYIEKEIIDNNV